MSERAEETLEDDYQLSCLNFVKFDPVPDHLPSILEYYQKCLSDHLAASLANLSPGNVVARCVGKKDLNENIRQSVVSVSSFQGVQRKVDCTGIIVDWNSLKSEGTILTSAKVLRFPKRSTRRHYHVIVRLFNGKLLEAKEEYVDYHMNIAILKVISTQTLKAVQLSCIKQSTDCLDITVLGRGFFKFSLEQVSGALLSHPPRFGCNELLSSTCRPIRFSEGGPVVSDSGDFIGMNFVDDEGYAHLLPSKSILDNLLTWRQTREIFYPWFGLTVIDATNLSLDVREMLSISSDDESCVFVKQVYCGSPADKLEVRPGDLVISCGGSPVVSVEKYCQIIHTISVDLSAFQARHGYGDKKSVQLEIRRHVDDKIVTVEAELLAVNDKRFCICWPFDVEVWHRKPLEGSQRDPLLTSWSPLMLEGGKELEPICYPAYVPGYSPSPQNYEHRYS